MGKVVIRVENLSKQYRLGQISTGTIVHDINRFWHSIRGLDDPYLKIAEENDRTKGGGGEYVWALRNTSFEVSEGEVLGIIGKNGAGKSTLLKLLSRTTLPSTGSIKVKGKIASLLEVGTGFHPDLSGRENIFLNGAILGMSKHEISKKFDEIVEFAGVEKYIDTPVKRYSSGMYVRLAFAVAAYLEPDILIVDEVLAVGDVEFQKKCLGKMRQVSQNDGKTILFVSHSMASIKSLCNRVIVLDKGKVSYDGAVNGAMDLYYGDGEISDRSEVTYQFDGSDVAINKIYITNDKGETVNHFTNENTVSLNLDVSVLKRIEQIEFSVCLTNSHHVNVIFSSLSDSLNRIPISLDTGRYILSAIVNPNFLVPDQYYLSVYVHLRNIKSIYSLEHVLRFNIAEVGSYLAPYGREAINIACIVGGAQWSVADFQNISE